MASYSFTVAPATYSFTTGGGPVEFPNRIYPFYIQSIRDSDAAEGDLLLKRWTEGLDAVWAQIDAKIRSLSTLVDPETCPAEALKYLKWIVGLTHSLDDLTGGLSEDDLRQLIAIAVRTWKRKGTGLGLVEALTSVSGNLVRYLTWFYFRIVLGELELDFTGDSDVDPWLLDQPGAAPWVRPDAVDVIGPIHRFDLSTLLGTEEAVPHDVRVRYLPRGVAQLVRSHWTGSRNECSVEDAFGLPTPLVDGSSVSSYLVGLDPDEYVSELRVVDDGTLDREFVANLVEVLRPAGERIFVRFFDFQDDFRSGDLRYWEVASGSVEPDGSAGVAYLEDPGSETEIVSDSPLAAAWANFTASVRFSLRDVVAAKWGEFRFLRSDSLNFYAVRVDPFLRTVTLQTVLAGVRSDLFTHGPMDVFHPGVPYTVHVLVERVNGGADALIKVLLDGNFIGEIEDPDHGAGALAVAVESTQLLTVHSADLVSCPYPFARVGPPPDAVPNWVHVCLPPP